MDGFSVVRRYRPARLAAVAAALAVLFWPGLMRRLFVSGDFMPHGHCYMWDAWLVRLHLVSDALIWASYVSISLTLAYLVYRARRAVPFHWMFLAFGLFIIACGFTHFMEIVTVWKPLYWMSGWVKLVTAAASVVTAVLLPPLIPKVRLLIDRARLSEERRARVEEFNRELEAVCYSLSHDLRAPLRSIEGFSHILAEDCAGKLDEEGHRNLERIQNASRRMALLIDDVLDLSRMTRADMELRPVNLTAMAREVADDLVRLSPGRRAEVSVQEGLADRGDPAMVRTVLENLIGNAWKFSAPRDPARVEFGFGPAPAGGRAYFVRDNGVGFDMAHADNMFKPFHRLHGPEFEGTGVGLAAVQRAVKRHGGRVWAEGVPDRGAVFYFTLGEAPGGRPAAG